MSRIEKLLQELCPNGVEYKKIGEIAIDIFRGAGITREQVTEEGTPCVRYGEIYTTYGIYFDTCVSHTDENSLASKKYFEHGDILFAITGESVEDIAKSTAYIGDEKCLAGGDIVVLKHNQNPKYLSYVLSTTEVQMQKSKGKVKSKVVHSSVPAIKDIVIPVPPIEVQSEIVKVLDNFTELTAELTARKKQYEYYASKMFLDTNADELPMEELAKFAYGYTDTAKDYGDTRFVRITDINEQGYLKQEEIKYISLSEEAKKYILQKGDIIMARTGATYGKTLYFDENIQAVYASFLIKIIPNERLLSRYYWHFTKTPLYWEQANKLVTTGGQPQFNTPALKQIKIPIPSIDEQERIVSILDRFDKLCNDISEGLPAEIEARRKQYEYYRDKLLSFKELRT